MTPEPHLLELVDSCIVAGFPYDILLMMCLIFIPIEMVFVTSFSAVYILLIWGEVAGLIVMVGGIILICAYISSLADLMHPAVGVRP
jgi:hypothetical protein